MIAMESQANMKSSKYVTTDIVETFIKEKAEYTINELRQELDARLKEETDKILGKLEKDLELKSSKIPSDLHGQYRKKTEVPLQTTKKEDSLERLPVNSSKVAKETVTNKQIQATPENTLANMLEYKDVLTKKKRKREYIFEGRHKKGFNESSITNYPPSITILSDAIELNPNNQNAYLNRGDAYYSLKQYKKSIADYNTTIELDPQNVIAYGRRGDAYGKLQQYENAIIDYNKSVDLDPEYAPAYNNRGNTLYIIRQYEKAIEDYTKTIELDPENDTVYSNRGLAYSGLEQYEKAIEDYIKAIELAPEDTYNYIYLSRLNIITDNYNSALAVITKALYLPINTETEALALYIECVVKKLLGKDTSLSEREFSEIIKNNFTIWWDFSKLDTWLENADTDGETKTFINEKSKLLAMHLEQ
ncbi:MAG: tetratricopeptide repeat protein [Candidatus Scalindua sp.]|nr:tetratricopeptide repeat protein [Candidatus Scalindua sp.]